MVPLVHEVGALAAYVRAVRGRSGLRARGGGDPVGGRYAGTGGARHCCVAADAGRGEPAGESDLGCLQGLRRPGVDAVPAGEGPEEAAAGEDRAGTQGQVVRAVDPEEPDHFEGARPHHERAGGRSRGARADDGVPPQAVGGGGVPSPPDGQGAAGLQEVDRQVRGRDRCRARGAGAAAGRAVRPLRPGWLTAPVPADRVRLARLQRAAQRQRLHRRRRVRLAAQRPCEGAQDPGPGGHRHRARLRARTRPTTPRPRRRSRSGPPWCRRWPPRGTPTSTSS